MCVEYRRNDPVFWVTDGTRRNATFEQEETTFRVGGSNDQPAKPPEFGGREVWPGLAETETLRLFRIQVEGEEGTRVVPLSQLRPASENP